MTVSHIPPADVPHAVEVAGGDGWRLAFDVGAVRDQPTGVGVYARSLAGALAGVMGGV